MSTRKFDNFDEFAEDYREIHNKNIKISGANSDYFSQYKVVEVFENNKTKNIETILDLGCGDGNSVKYFSQYFTNSRIYGVDVSEKSIETAKKRNLVDCFFSAYDGKHLPFKDESFDIVFIAGVLHHVNKDLHLGIIRECYRTLKSNGEIYIFEHNPINPLTRKIVKDCVFDEDAILINSGYTRKLVRASGFNDINNKYTIFFPRHEIFRPFIKFERFLSKLPLGGQYYVSAKKE